MSHVPAARPSRSNSASLLRASGTLAALAALLVARGVHAEPGTHGPAISTWDTRASSVVVGFRPGFLGGGHFDIVSYNANFSATSGNLSSQFGVHYLNVRPGALETVLQGMGATAIALFSIPVMPRYDNGMPKLAVGLYLGAAPSVLINGRASYLSVPFPLGFGLPYTPAKAITITPWFEAAPAVNLDTQVRQSTLALDPTQFQTNGTSIALTDSAVNQILNSAVSFRVRATVGMRAGLDIGVHLSDSVDLNLNGMMGSFGGAFGGTFIGWLGAGLAFRWDNVVPAVLPAEKRLLKEECSDIEVRYRACQTTNGETMTPVRPNANPPPAYPSVPVTPPPQPAYPPLQAPPPPPAPPAPVPPASDLPSPGSDAPPAAAPEATPPGSTVPTTGFPQ